MVVDGVVSVRGAVCGLCGWMEGVRNSTKKNMTVGSSSSTISNTSIM